jgi:hypothetical protein
LGSEVSSRLSPLDLEPFNHVGLPPLEGDLCEEIRDQAEQSKDFPWPYAGINLDLIFLLIAANETLNERHAEPPQLLNLGFPSAGGFPPAREPLFFCVAPVPLIPRASPFRPAMAPRPAPNKGVGPTDALGDSAEIPGGSQIQEGLKCCVRLGPFSQKTVPGTLACLVIFGFERHNEVVLSSAHEIPEPKMAPTFVILREDQHCRRPT